MHVSVCAAMRASTRLRRCSCRQRILPSDGSHIGIVVFSHLPVKAALSDCVWARRKGSILEPIRLTQSWGRFLRGSEEG
eukprot:scaffold63303_cov52-Phaeocystis_antarctica.AAC.3